MNQYLIKARLQNLSRDINRAILDGAFEAHDKLQREYTEIVSEWRMLKVAGKVK